MTEPVFSRGEKQGEQQEIGLQAFAVDPQQAGKQHRERIGAQLVNVGGAVQQHRVQLATGQLVLDDRRDRQRE
jgi:hypothetical protein